MAIHPTSFSTDEFFPLIPIIIKAIFSAVEMDMTQKRNWPRFESNSMGVEGKMTRRTIFSNYEKLALPVA